MRKSNQNNEILHETFFDIISKGDQDLLNDFIMNNPSLDMNYLDDNNQNGLFYAICSIESDEKCFQIFQWLIGKGMEPSIIDKYNQTPLFYSCSAGLCTTTEWLIEKFKLNVNHCDVNGQTPFFYAVKENRKAIIELLMAKGADRHHLDKENLNCFYMIENNDYADLVVYLLEIGIDPNVIGKNGQRYIKKAERMGLFKITDALKNKHDIHKAKTTKYILTNKKTKKPLTEKEMEALRKDQPEIIRLLEDPEYLKLQMNENSSSDIVDINI